MENYSKGKNVEELLEKDNLPIPNLPENFLWMLVKGGSRIRDLLDVALHSEEGITVVWSGAGAGLKKAISCAEMFKFKRPGLHQFNVVHYKRDEEHWDPKIDGLDPLVIMRDIPTIHIALSIAPLNENLPGYQSPEGEYAANKKVPKGGGRGGKRGDGGWRGGKGKEIKDGRMEELGLRSQGRATKKRSRNNKPFQSKGRDQNESKSS